MSTSLEVDGHPLTITLQRPQGKPPSEGSPAILFCPGLRGISQQLNQSVLSYFARRGYATASVHYRDLKPSNGVRRISPLDRTHDAAAALEWITHQESIDANALGVYGISYGGPVGICAASLVPSVSAVVSVCGPGNGWKMMRDVRSRSEWAIFLATIEEDRCRTESGLPSKHVSLQEILPFSESYHQKMADIQKELGLDPEADQAPEYLLESAHEILNFHPEYAVSRIKRAALLQICGEQDELTTRSQIEEVDHMACAAHEVIWLRGLDHLDLHIPPALETQLSLSADWMDRFLPTGSGT